MKRPGVSVCSTGQWAGCPLRFPSCLCTPAAVLVGVLVPLLGPAAVATAGAEAPVATSQPGEHGAVEIDSLIRQLGDPSYRLRTEATRRLALLGHRAAGALDRAAREGTPETRLRAGHLLGMLDELYFGGCTVRLEVDRTRLAWNEPLALDVIIRNECGYRSFLPLEPDAGRPEHVRLVGDLVDLADYLEVIDPEGRPVEMRVDDVWSDPAVAEAVAWRSEGGPVLELPPGQQVVVRLHPLNRGWARYPLLSAGIYRIRIEYAPVWGDARLDEAGLGRVCSNRLEVEVTEAADPVVQRGFGVPRVTLSRCDEHVVATMTNTDDLPVWVNLNTGVQAPGAQLSWLAICGEYLAPVDARQRAAAMSFDRNHIRELAPGASIDVGRISLAEVLSAKLVETIPPEAPVQLRAIWTNQCDRVWQRRQQVKADAEDALRTPLPRRMVVGRVQSALLDLTPFRRP